MTNRHHSRHAVSQDGQSASELPVYVRPKLTCHGSLSQLTRQSGPPGSFPGGGNSGGPGGWGPGNGINGR